MFFLPVGFLALTSEFGNVHNMLDTEQPVLSVSYARIVLHSSVHSSVTGKCSVDSKIINREHLVYTSLLRVLASSG